MTEPVYHVGIDVGGTFTDLTIYDAADASTFAVKVPSNRAAPESAVLAALDRSGVDPARVRLIVHGTTVATNALLERRGSRVAFVTTDGFRDVLELGRTTRLVPNSLYDPYFRRPPALVPRRDRRVVRERILHDGAIEVALEEAELEALARELAAADVEAVAIGFLNSYRNAAHERLAETVFARHFEFVTISTAILNEVREFERFSAAATNAYVMPVMARYTRRLTEAIKARNAGTAFYTVASDGGLLSTRSVEIEPVRTVLSGPAAGIAATIHLAGTLGLPNVIAYDMGGTSTDVALVVDGAFPHRRETVLEGLVIRLPQLDIHTVGAGGGSIASLDKGGALQLGPESAGSEPGPACYGKGGVRPTVTDANVVLGRLGAGQELGRTLRIDRATAEAAIGTLAAAAGLATGDMAEAMLRLAVAKMAAAVHEISVARGFDPRDFVLLSYGGAGPLHAALVADDIAIPHVVIPPSPGAFSAFGALCSALSKDRSMTVLTRFDAGAAELAASRLAQMERELAAEFERDGADVAALDWERQYDMRYAGQAHELTVAVSEAMSVAEVVERFEAVFEREYGRRDRDRAVELVNVRLVARLPIETPRFNPVVAAAAAAPGSRRVVADGVARTCPVLDRDGLERGRQLVGPLVVEEMSSTTFVPPGWTATVGEFGELHLRRS